MVGCANRQNKKKAGISLHRIPQLPKSRKEAWIKIKNRLHIDGDKQRQWEPTKYSRICSIYFLGGLYAFFLSDQ